MAWTAPFTAVTGTVANASDWNTSARDNLNALNTRINHSATTATAEGRANATYGDLATVGPTVSSLTTGTFALVVIGAHFSNNTNAAQSLMSFAVSGATTLAAADANVAGAQFPTAASAAIYTSSVIPVTLTAGSNTFTAKYRSSGADTATFSNRILCVIPQF